MAIQADKESWGWEVSGTWADILQWVEQNPQVAESKDIVVSFIVDQGIDPNPSFQASLDTALTDSNLMTGLSDDQLR